MPKSNQRNGMPQHWQSEIETPLPLMFPGILEHEFLKM